MGLHERWQGRVLIAGAAHGLGAAWARGLTARGVPTTLVDRDGAAVCALAAELGELARPVVVDLAAADIDEVLAPHLAEAGALIYNACASAPGPFLTRGRDEKVAMLEVNARAPLLLAHALAPRLAARGRGALIFVSSLSAFQGSAMVATYAATKAFDLILGESLWAELSPLGVDVAVIACGAMPTPGFLSVTPAARRGLARPTPVDDTVREALDWLQAGGASREPMFIPGFGNRWSQALLSLLPRRLASRLVSDRTIRMYGDRG